MWHNLPDKQNHVTMSSDFVWQVTYPFWKRWWWGGGGPPPDPRPICSSLRALLYSTLRALCTVVFGQYTSFIYSSLGALYVQQSWGTICTAALGHYMYNSLGALYVYIQKVKVEEVYSLVSSSANHLTIRNYPLVRWPGHSYKAISTPRGAYSLLLSRRWKLFNHTEAFTVLPGTYLLLGRKSALVGKELAYIVELYVTQTPWIIAKTHLEKYGHVADVGLHANFIWINAIMIQSIFILLKQLIS